MIDPGPPTLHVVTPPDRRRQGAPAGELLYAMIAARQRDTDAALLFGDSADRRAAEMLGVRNVRLARKPTGLGARRIITEITNNAAEHLSRNHGSAGAPLLLGWSPELAFLRVAIVQPGADDLATDAIARLPDRATARAELELGDGPTLAPLSASTAHVDTRALAFVSGVLDLLGHHHTIILPEPSQRFEEGLRFIRRTELYTRVVLVRTPLLCALPAADVLIEPEYSPQDLESPVPHALRRIADALGTPYASTHGWDTNQGLGHGNLPPEMVATVVPAVRALQSLTPDTPLSPRLR